MANSAHVDPKMNCTLVEQCCLGFLAKRSFCCSFRMNYIFASISSVIILSLGLAVLTVESHLPERSHSHHAREVYVRVSTILVEPYVMRVDDYSEYDNLEYNGYDSETHQPVVYVGYMVDLLDKLMQVLGLKYRLFPAKDNQYGFLRPDGSWDGMIGELLRGEVDLAAAPLLITEQRKSVVDFSRPFLTIQATVLIRRPSTGHDPVIQSAMELTQQRKMQYGTQKGGLVWRAFRKTNNSHYHDLWRNMRSFDSSVFTTNNEEGITKVRHGNYAYLLPSTIGHYISQQEPCDLITVDRFLMNEHFGLAMQRGAGLLTQLNKALIRLEAEGFLDRLYEKYWLKRSRCGSIQSSKMYSLSSHAHFIHQVGCHDIAIVTVAIVIYLGLTAR